VAIGYDSLYSNDNDGAGFSSGNTAVGCLALYSNTDGAFNTALGYNALYRATNTYGQGFNTAVGYEALYNATTGENNTAIGGGCNITTGNNNIIIGDYNPNNPMLPYADTSTDNAYIRIGYQGLQTKTFIAGISGATAASGVAVYVNGSGQLGTLTSSARFKQDIRSMDDASDVILSLKPVTFRYKPQFDPLGLPQFGLVAEQVEKVCPSLVAHDDKGQVYTVRYEAVNAMLLNEFLKEHKRVEEMGRTDAELVKQVAAQQKVNAEQAQTIGEQGKQLAAQQATIAEEQQMIKTLAASFKNLDGQVRQVRDQLSGTKPQLVKAALEQ
jgi:hypothetical protein